MTALHVEWPVATDDDDLSMDDVVDYFEGFGQILGTDMPEQSKTKYPYGDNGCTM
jgi:hypothetical protein